MSAQNTTAARSTDERLAGRIARFFSNFEGAHELFTPDVLIDLNVPQWRFQLQGPDGITSLLRDSAPSGNRITTLSTTSMDGGFLTQIEGSYDGENGEMYFRNLLVCQVDADRISEMLIYCTGDWDAETRARQRSEAPMIRP